jgi:BirA family transcriptional regulator, biotin operon repressor / biotin---[acetyl-CoA-carboxylase] ligase
MQAETLLHELADGELHSGEALARSLGVTRAAVWKHVRALEGWGLAVQAQAGRGYRLEQPLDLIDAERLRASLRGRLALERLEVFTELDSTNSYLTAAAPPAPGALAACIAEYQRAGRGRRGRSWTAPLASGLCLSVAWQFAETPPDYSALALAVGVVVRRVLGTLAGVELELKWPNDLVHRERKLGGILIEATSQAYGPCSVVIGLGLNVAMPAAMLATLSDWPSGATDLRAAAGGTPPRREALAAELLVALAALLTDYAQSGFTPYRAEWNAADYLCGRPVSVSATDATLRGAARGVDADGALLIETHDAQHLRIVSGDVSVRGEPCYS